MKHQVRAGGATWLDRQLVGKGRMSLQRFSAKVADALQRRVVFLKEHGLAEQLGGRILLAPGPLSKLRDRELMAQAKLLQAETGRTLRPLRGATRVSGIYQQSIQLISGQFALLDAGMGFSLVSWRPVIAHRVGQTVAAVVRGS